MGHVRLWVVIFARFNRIYNSIDFDCEEILKRYDEGDSSKTIEFKQLNSQNMKRFVPVLTRYKWQRLSNMEKLMRDWLIARINQYISMLINFESKRESFNTRPLIYVIYHLLTAKEAVFISNLV